MTSAKRITPLPAMPTLDEAGLKPFEVTQWFAVLAPARTPAQVVARLQREIAAVLRNPADSQHMIAEGSEAVGNSPAEFAHAMRQEYAAWDTLIRSANIRSA